MIERHYLVLGLRLMVTADDPGVGAAVDHRLRAWRTEPAPEAVLRLEFRTEELKPAADVERTGAHRPVYDTPDGQVVYWPDQDAVDADFGQVQMRGDVGAGVVRISSSAFEGRDRYLAAHPMTMIALTELLRRRGLYPVHAGCVAQGTRGAMFAGPSGSGKSTLTLALVQAGFQFLSDDLVFLRESDGPGRVLGFPDAVGVTAATVARFGELSALHERPPEPGWRKHVIRVEEHFSVTVTPSCAPVALIFPEIGPGESRLEPLDPGEGWLRLVPDVLLTEPAAAQAHLKSLAALSEQVDSYRLRSGPDLSHSVALVSELLA